MREFYEWPYMKRLAEKGRINQATLKSLWWSLSIKPWIYHKKLQDAHFQILRLRRQIRQGFLVPEEQERTAYERYAKALSRLEDFIGRDIQAPFNIYD